MKYYIFFFFCYFYAQSIFGQTKLYPDNANIVYLEFAQEGVNLKLTIDGIKLGKKRSGSDYLASVVVSEHTRFSGGKTDIKQGLMAAQILAHCIAYNLSKSASDGFNKRANPINVKYWEVMITIQTPRRRN